MEYGMSVIWCYVGDAKQCEGLFGELESTKG
jgi:hypothetical protein